MIGLSIRIIADMRWTMKLFNGSGSAFAVGPQSASPGCCSSQLELRVFLSMVSKICKVRMVRADSRLKNLVIHHNYQRGLSTLKVACMIVIYMLFFSHTCFNRLDLPPYKDYESLEQKLTLAVEYVYKYCISSCTVWLTSFAERLLASARSKLLYVSRIWMTGTDLLHSDLFVFITLYDFASPR